MPVIDRSEPAPGHGTADLTLQDIPQHYWSFAYACMMRGLAPGTYNSAVIACISNYLDRAVAYPLLLFLAISTMLGLGGVWLILSFLSEYGLRDLASNVVVRILIKELSPLIAVLFIALRMGPWSNAGIALMRSNGEIRALNAYGIDVLDYLCVPRIAGCIVSTAILATLFNSAIITANILFPLLAPVIGFQYYMLNLVETISFVDLFVLAIKSGLFGFFVATVPLYAALRADNKDEVPSSVLQGMDSTLLTIIALEGLSLALSF